MRNQERLLGSSHWTTEEVIHWDGQNCVWNDLGGRSETQLWAFWGWDAYCTFKYKEFNAWIWKRGMVGDIKF